MLYYYRTPFDQAWDQILGSNLDGDRQNVLRSIFPDTSGRLEYRQFTRIHKIVLNISYNDLDEELNASTACIDVVDSQGRTPLSWAARRGDSEAVKTLLSQGACPNTADISGYSPLHWAAQASTPAAMEPLLAAGAEVDRRTIASNFTPLLLAASYQLEPSFLDTLLSHGAEINAYDSYARTPLIRAALYDRQELVGYLLAHDACIDLRDRTGCSALMSAILRNSHRSLQILLDAGADTTLKDTDGWTVLHLAARRGSIETFNFLSDARMRKVDLTAKADNVNLTAMEMAEKRQRGDPEWFHETEITASWWKAWMRLVKSVAGPDCEDEMASDIDGEEIFVDAVAYPTRT